jgi:hypothetical protein
LRLHAGHHRLRALLNSGANSIGTGTWMSDDLTPEWPLVIHPALQLQFVGVARFILSRSLNSEHPEKFWHEKLIGLYHPPWAGRLVYTDVRLRKGHLRVELRGGSVISGPTFSEQLFEASAQVIFAMSNMASSDVIQNATLVNASWKLSLTF